MSFSLNYPTIRPSLNLNFAREKILDPRVTFTRASTGTYYDGVTTAKAEENLLLQSQDFTVTASWGSLAGGNLSAITSNATNAPDGTATAEEIIENTTTSFHRCSQSSSASGTITFSVFAKVSVGTRFLVISASKDTSNYASAAFNLSTGVATQTLTAGVYGTPTTAVTDAGGGWYRCSITVSVDTATSFTIGMSSTDTFVNSNRGFPSYTGDNTSSIFLWGAQLEQRGSVTAYTPTTTQPITNYVPVLQTAANNVARFDHNPATNESLGLLIEESRTNLFQYSSEFDNAYWSKTRSSITENTIVAPDGTLTGDKLVEDTTASNTHQIARSVSYTSGTTYTYSFFAKAGERTRVAFQFPSLAFTDPINITFDLNTGTVVAVGAGGTASISSVGNGWFRCVGTATATITTSATTAWVRLIQTGVTTIYTGDGYSGIYIWGAQLEAAAFSTSYIATGAAAATRATDAASMIGPNFSSWFNNAEGTIYTELAWPTIGTVTNGGAVTISDGTTNNRIGINRAGVGATPQFGVASAGVTQAGPFVGNVSANVFFKIIGAYKTDDFAIAVNGAQTGNSTDTSGSVPVVDRMFFGDAIGAVSSRYMKRVAYYPLRLTNAQLQALTKTSTPRTYPATLPSLNLNFARARVLDPRITFTRASTASYFDSAGVLQSAANDAARFDHDPVTGESLGLLIEEQRTNSIRNNTMAGAVAGSPGTLPTNWTSQAVGGVSITEVIGIGIENGISYVDVKYAGTTSSTATGGILTEGGLIVAASSGQTWASSFFIKLVGGSLAGITSINNNIIERDSGGVLVASTNTVITPTSAALNSQRVSTTRTLNNVSTAFVQQRIAIIPQSGVAVDFTLRIGLPQLELGAFATSVIPTTGSAATRLADTATMTGANFSNWYNAAEGTLFTEFAWVGLRSAAGQRILIVDNGTTTNYWGMVGTSSNTMQNPVVVNGVTEATNGTPATTYSVNTYYKQAVAIAVNNTVAAINGVSGTTDTAALVPTVNTLRLCASSAGVGENIRIRRIAYYPLRLTNAQLQALTS